MAAPQIDLMHLTLFGNCTFIQSVIRHKLSGAQIHRRIQV